MLFGGLASCDKVQLIHCSRHACARLLPFIEGMHYMPTAAFNKAIHLHFRLLQMWKLSVYYCTSALLSLYGTYKVTQRA